MSTVYLVTGANRGIGFSLVKSLSTRSDVLIFAGCRDPSKATDLNTLAKETNGKVVPISIISADVENNQLAAKEILDKVGKVDVVIANAGINLLKPTLETSPEEFSEQLRVNVVGNFVLYQQFRELINNSTFPGGPKLIFITTGLASISQPWPVPAIAYATSKTALNQVAITINREESGWIVFPIHPGAVLTDMGHQAILDIPALKHAPYITPEVSADSILGVVDGATKEKNGGKFMSYDGSEIPW